MCFKDNIVHFRKENSEIDRLVYQIYGLTDEELAFIIRSAMPLGSSKNYDIG